MEFQVDDFEQCDKLIWYIANKEYSRYLMRVKYAKLEKEDFYQNGWLAMQDCINKGITNLSYICVAIRNSMFRGVMKTSIIQTSNKEVLWKYISGNEVRLDQEVYEDTELGEIIQLDNSTSLEEEAINRVLVRSIMDKMNESDKEELVLFMLGLPPIKRHRRDKVKQRARKLLEGENPYEWQSAKQSEIKGVTYDKSKDRWVFSKRIDGRTKTFMRSRSKEEAEEYAKKYYAQVASM